MSRRNKKFSEDIENKWTHTVPQRSAQQNDKKVGGEGEIAEGDHHRITLFK